MKLRQRIITAAALLILAVMFAFEITSSRQESQTIDEAVHLAAGYSYWKTGDFRMNPEHPPLIKMLAAFPLLFTKATLPTHDPSWQKVDEWKFGEVFLYHNTLSPDTLLLLGRLPIMLLSLVLGWAIFRASGAMFGTVAGFLSLGLYAFDPNVIAHSRYVTTDLGFTALMFFSLLALQKLLAQPNRKHAVWFGLALFVTSLSKFSFPVLVVALLVLLAVLKALQPHHPALQWSRWGQGLLVAIPIALVATWAVYGFELRRPVDDPRVMYLYQQRQDLLGSKLLAEQSPWKRYVVTTLGDQTKGIGKTAAHLLTLRYPLYSFFRGSISVLGHSEIGQSSFVLGQFGNQGWWYYFPVAFFTKTPPLTLLMFLGSAVGFVMLLIKTRHERKSWLDGFRSLDRRWYLLGIPAVVYFGFSLFSHLDLGWRYLMPIYPPLFVMSGSVVMVPWVKKLRARWMMPLVIAIVALATELAAWPNQLGYFSPLVGGMHNGHNILRDSNLDWGQDLPKLRDYLRQHHIASVMVAYYGAAHIDVYVASARPLPTNEEVQLGGVPRGYAAISAEKLFSADQAYEWLRIRPIQALIGSSIYLFHLP